MIGLEINKSFGATCGEILSKLIFPLSYGIHATSEVVATNSNTFAPCLNMEETGKKMHDAI